MSQQPDPQPPTQVLSGSSETGGELRWREPSDNTTEEMVISVEEAISRVIDCGETCHSVNEAIEQFRRQPLAHHLELPRVHQRGHQAGPQVAPPE